jgi:hypothetical protein
MASVAVAITALVVANVVRAESVSVVEWLPLAGAVSALAVVSTYVTQRSRERGAAAREDLSEAEHRLTSVLAGEFRVTGGRIAYLGDERLADVLSIPPQVEGEGPTVPQQTEQAERPERADRAQNLALASLWEVTHKRLALYHDIATGQAKRSFISAQVAMGLGFLLLCGFVFAAVQAEKTAAAAVAGALGAVAAAMAAFVSRTFVKSQESAAEHLKAYFDQPLEFSRYLAAERLLHSADLPAEQRAEVVKELVQIIAAGPQPLVDAGASLLEQLPRVMQGDRQP